MWVSVFESGSELKSPMEEGFADHLGHLVTDFKNVEEFSHDNVEGVGIDLVQVNQPVDAGEPIEHMSIGFDRITQFHGVLTGVVFR